MERKAQGAKLGAEDVVDVQRDVQRQKQLERAQKDVQRVLQTASESENKLDVALKVRYFFYGSFAIFLLSLGSLCCSSNRNLSSIFHSLQIEQAKRQQALHARLTVRRTTVAKK